jgi:predicted ATP-binding protein involved in virulence
MRLRAIVIRDLEPFAPQTIEFPLGEAAHPELADVQLLTGENGTGKTRLLCLIAAALGNDKNLVERASKNRTRAVLVVFGDKDRSVLWEWPSNYTVSIAAKIPITKSLNTYTIGQPLDGATVVGTSGVNDAITSKSQFAAFAFRGTLRVEDAVIEAMKPVNVGKWSEHLDFDFKNNSPVLCQSMANLKMSAAMEHLNKHRKGKSRATTIVQRLEDAVTEITKKEFAFDVTASPETAIRAYWDGNDLRFGQLPDGLRSIIGWLVSCVARVDSMYPTHPDPLAIPMILLIDEPETHLHIAWQRHVLPIAQQLFPQAQIIAATHSPFVISSVNHGTIHKLGWNKEHKVADQVTPCPDGDSFIDVVEDVLGLSKWYDPETEAMLEAFRKNRDSVKTDEEFGILEALAKNIAERGPGLKEMMGRELAQIRRFREVEKDS